MNTHNIVSINQINHVASIDHNTGRGKAEIETIKTYDDGKQELNIVDYAFTSYDKKGNTNNQDVSKGSNVNIRA